MFRISQTDAPRVSLAARRLARSRRLIGLPLEEAEALAAGRGVTLRDYPDDWQGPQHVALTTDFQPTRVTVGTTQSVVRRIIDVG